MDKQSLISPWIKLKEYLEQEDYDLIHALQELCMKTDKVALKLELDYKLSDAKERKAISAMKQVNEFMYFDGEQLIGYIGICSFGGAGMPLEITGMVHPDFRQQGVFTMLHDLVLAECKRRKAGNVLLLSDKKSEAGQRFVKKIGAVYKNSEYEMYLKENCQKPEEGLLCGITFRKAVNTDAYEIARQNAIFFGDSAPVEEGDLLLPEEEEKRGMTIFFAQKGSDVIGKVHLDMNTEVGGIYGLGILPEYRGKGYGRALLLKAVEKFKEDKIHKVMLQVATENATALGLYQSCGFAETSTMDYYELIS